jgi:hypothetical protein
MLSTAAQAEVAAVHKADQYVWDVANHLWCTRTRCGDIFIIEAADYSWHRVTCIDCHQEHNMPPEPRWNAREAAKEGFLLNPPGRYRIGMN